MATAVKNASATVFGVDFVWPRPGPMWHERLRPGFLRLHEDIARQLAPALKRQKREFLGYWDAMSLLQYGRPIPPERWGDDTVLFAVDLVNAIGSGKPADHVLMELSQCPDIEGVRSEIQLHGGGGDPASSRALQRMRPDEVIFDARGRPRPRKPGLYRRLSLDMDELEGGPESIDWPYVLVLAVLIQIRCDVELYLETGIWRLLRCERVACRSFFPRRSFSGRPPRFCSASCRASAAREQ